MLMPVAKLSTGITVANFSSPHRFNFVTGDLLHACSPERAQLLKLEAIETEIETNHKKWTDISIRYTMTPEVERALRIANAIQSLDIILVPRIVLDVIKQSGMFEQFPKCRSIRTADRVTKMIYADKFCL